MNWIRKNKWYLLIELWFILPVIVFAIFSLYSYLAGIISLFVSVPLVFVLVKKTNQLMISSKHEDD